MELDWQPIETAIGAGPFLTWSADEGLAMGIRDDLFREMWYAAAGDLPTDSTGAGVYQSIKPTHWTPVHPPLPYQKD